MKRLALLAIVIGSAAVLGCNKPADNSATDSATKGNTASSVEMPLVVFAQANSQDPWRQVFDAEMRDAYDKDFSKRIKFEEQDAQDDPTKQMSVIETLMLKKPKVLLVSPVDESLEQTLAKVYDSGVPVILLDRGVPGEKFTAYIGGDNVEIGRQAGEFMAKKLNGKGTVLMIQGTAAADPTKHRAQGFMEAISKFPDIKVISGDDCGYQRQKARSYMESFLQSGKPFDAVYAHNDEMAIGAYFAIEAAQAPKKVIVGIDGCQKEVVEMIKAGKLDATFKYPTPGVIGMDLASQIVEGNKTPQRKYVLPTEIVTAENADKYLAENPNLAK